MWKVLWFMWWIVSTWWRFHVLKVTVYHQSLTMFSHIMAMKLILLFVIKYSMMGNGLNRMLWSLLRYAKVESGILFHVYEVQRYFLVSSCFKLSTILKQAIFFTHIFRSKYFVSPLECFQCLLMFSKLNGGNGL